MALLFSLKVGKDSTIAWTVYEKIILKCQAFVVSLTDHLALMPFGIRWIARQLYKYARALFLSRRTKRPSLLLHYSAALRKGMSVQDATGMLGDLLLMRFISPAILYPEPYGIVLDTPISNTARRNLTLVCRHCYRLSFFFDSNQCCLNASQIAKVLRLVGRSVSVSQREPFMIPLHERLNTVALDQFYAQVINCPDLKRGLPVRPFEPAWSTTDPRLPDSSSTASTITRAVTSSS